MCKKTKIWLVLATLLVLFGLLIFSFSMINLEWNFSKLDKSEYERNIYTFEEKIKDIYIETTTPDITFLPSGNGEIKIECYEEKNEKHRVEIVDGVLNIQLINEKKWYEYIGIFNFKTPKITVYIPQGEYGELFVKSSTGNVEIPKEFKFENIDILKSTGNVTNYASASENITIKTSTGDIRVENVSANTFDLSVSTGGVTVSNVTCEGDVKINVSTGKTNLTNIECKNVVSNGDTGAISLKNVIAADKFSIERSTGAVKFDGCDAAEIFLETDTGDVRGSLLSDKIFVIRTEIGNVDVPKTTSGGKCEITTATGDINISIKK